MPSVTTLSGEFLSRLLHHVNTSATNRDMIATTLSESAGSPGGRRGGRAASRSTMRDVAEAAGVSLKTVSRVVNDEPGVKGDLRDRVLSAVEKLDYRHNLVASNLRRSDARTGVIGVLVQDLANSFSSSLVRALEDAMRPHKVMIVAASLDETTLREQHMVENLISRRVDGLVLVPASARQDYLAPEVRSGFPVVFADRAPRGIETDSVVIDHALGGFMAVDHLLANGHRRIAIIADSSTITTASERVRGVRAAFTKYGLEVPEDLVRVGERTEEGARAAVHELRSLPDPPTAIFAGRNTIAQGAVRALSQRGERERVALVGFDDFPMSDLLGLTVIRQDVSRLGALVGERLLARIQGDTSPPSQQVLPPALIARGSGEIPPPRVAG